MASPQRITFPSIARLLVPATLVAAAAALGGSAVGDPTVACAAPREWDIGAYDECTTRINDMANRGIIQRGRDFVSYQEFCCTKSGGDWNSETGSCQAPPAEQDAQTGPQVNLPPGGVPQLTVAPASPGPVAPQTPAPASPG